MSNLKTKLWQFFILFALTIAGCDSDDPADPTKSSAKEITSFKFSGLNPEVTASVSQDKKTISAIVPANTDVTALVPTIVVSEKATVSPAPGVATDFTNSVTYTVTAEDGSAQQYVATVTVDGEEEEEEQEEEEEEEEQEQEENGPVIEEVLETTVEQGATLTINGSNFGDPASIRVILKNTSTEEEIEITAESSSTSAALRFVIPDDLAIGTYTIQVIVGEEIFEVDAEIEIVVPAPVIISVSKTAVVEGENITITGKNFAESGNIVRLTDDGGFSFTCAIVSESETSIEVTIPATFEYGEHTLSVDADGIVVEFSEVIEVLDPTTPVITSINKTTFNVEETIVITGQNLKGDLSTIIYFWPLPTGVAFQRIASVNGDGTEASYTIPADFEPGDYEINVEVDFDEVSGFSEIITIN